jgi:mannobiose 2-epimerase
MDICRKQALTVPQNLYRNDDFQNNCINFRYWFTNIRQNMKSFRGLYLLAILPLLLTSCLSRPNMKRQKLASRMEKSLFGDLIDHWYPLDVDTVYGGFISDLDYDWAVSDGPQFKALVQQARHIWATSFLYQAYPGREEFLGYAAQGFRFLKGRMWDPEYGGFFTFCERDGVPREEAINDKRIYGQAFAVYGLSRYYMASRDTEALDLARKAFLWMETHAHDPENRGYFELLKRDGSPLAVGNTEGTGLWDARAAGLKDYNSSIHLMEALTELYRVWPDSLVRARLEEMFFLIRDTFVHPGGYLQLYFYPDWTLVPEEDMDNPFGVNYWFSQHFSYGHDVETAYLLLETAGVLGWGDDEMTRQIAKQLVDHSLESGWDQTVGGFFDAGKQSGSEITILNHHKSWWGQAEGMNALLLMALLYPDDPNDYYGKFLKSWKYISTCLIDKQHGGWYNYGLDTFPENAEQQKSHIWKTTYHNTRAMVHCIRMLREGKAERSPYV